MTLRRLGHLAPLLVVLACGDDGGGTDGSGSSGSSSSGSTTTPTSSSTTNDSMTTASSSTTDPSTTTDVTSSTTDGTGSTGGDEGEGASGSYRFSSALAFTVYDMAPHPDGGVVIAGNVLRDPMGTPSREAAVARIDDDGSVVWSQRTEWAGNEQFFGVLVDGSTVYGIGLSRRDGGMGNNDEILIAQFGLDGTYSGSVLFGDPTTDEHGWDAVATSDGGLIVVGYTNQTGFGDRDAMVLKLDDQLQSDWAVGVGGGQRDIFYSVTEDSNGGFLAVGDRGQSPTTSDSLAVRLEANGTLDWSISFGNGGEDSMQGIQPLGQGRYLIAGETSSWGAGSIDGYFGILDPDGDPVLSLSSVGGTGFDSWRELTPIGNDQFIASGLLTSLSMNDDVWFGRIDASDDATLSGVFAYPADRLQRSFGGAAALRADGGFALGFHDADDVDDETLEPGVLYTDSLGGLDVACPVPDLDAYSAQSFDAGTPDTTISQGTPTFTRTALATTDDPVVTLNMGMSAPVCE